MMDLEKNEENEMHARFFVMVGKEWNPLGWAFLFLVLMIYCYKKWRKKQKKKRKKTKGIIM